MATATKIDFNRMWIDLSGSPYQQLVDGEILHAQHASAAFVMALSPTETPDSLREEVEMSIDAFGNLDVPVFVVYFGTPELTVMKDRAPDYFWIEVQHRDGTVAGEMRFSLAGGGTLKTELGVQTVETIVLNELNKGDVFAIAERDGRSRWVLYRATGVDDPSTGLPYERLRPRKGQPETDVFTLSGNHIVFRVKDPEDVLEQMALDDIRAQA